MPARIAAPLLAVDVVDFAKGARAFWTARTRVRAYSWRALQRRPASEAGVSDAARASKLVS